MKNKTLKFVLPIVALAILVLGIMQQNGEILKVEENKISANPMVVLASNEGEVPFKYTDFFYEVGSRYSGITKEKLNKIKSFNEIYQPEEGRPNTYHTVSVIIVEKDKETNKKAIGNSQWFTPEQLDLLQNATYSTNFLVRAEFGKPKACQSASGPHYFSPYKTIVPSQQAEFLEGKKALLSYISENNKINTLHLKESKLKPAKLYFTITATGAIDKVRVDRSCGYPHIDNAMRTLISNTKGKWKVARDLKGETVEQELVLSYGRVGC